MTVREIETKLKEDGWQVSKQIGSHRQYKHPIKKGEYYENYLSSNFNSM